MPAHRGLDTDSASASPGSTTCLSRWSSREERQRRTRRDPRTPPAKPTTGRRRPDRRPDLPAETEHHRAFGSTTTPPKSVTPAKGLRGSSLPPSQLNHPVGSHKRFRAPVYPGLDTDSASASPGSTTCLSRWSSREERQRRTRRDPRTPPAKPTTGRRRPDRRRSRRLDRHHSRLLLETTTPPRRADTGKEGLRGSSPLTTQPPGGVHKTFPCRPQGSRHGLG